jgi:hypothetical protein
MSVWAEYNPVLHQIRVYAVDVPQGAFEVRCSDKETLEVTVAGRSMFCIPIEPMSDHSETLTIDPHSSGVQSCTVHGTLAVVPPVEDWSSDWGEVRCRDTSAVVVNMDSLEPCLMPSATWGFEDMRVCEECGPIACGAKKRGRKNFFLIDQFNIFLESGFGEELVLGDLDRIRSIAPGWDTCFRFPKHKLVGPRFLDFYSPESEIRAKWFDEKSICRVLAKDVTVVSVDGIRPMARVLVRDGSEGLDQFLKDSFVLPPAFSPMKGWTVALVPVPPQIVEL